LLVAKATIAERTCWLEVATAKFSRAVELAPAGHARAMMQMRLAIVRALEGDDEAVARLSDEIGATIGAPNDLDLARLAWMRAIIHALQLQWTECIAIVEEGRRAAKRASATDLDYLLVLIELMAASELGDVARATTLAAEVASSQPNQYLRQRMTLLYVGVSELAVGHVGRAVETLERAFHEYDLHHDTLLALLAGHYWGRALLIHGDMARSVDVLAKVAQRAQDAGLRPLVGPGQLHLARALLSLGRVVESTEIAERLVHEPVDLIAGEAHALLAYKHAFEGDLDQARLEMTKALTRVGDREPIWANLVLDQAYIELLGGDPERARTAALSIVEDQRRMTRPYSRGRALFILAIADLAAGMVDTAIVTLAEVDALAAEYGMNYLQTRTALLRSATSHHGASILDRVPLEHHRGYLGILRVLGLRPETVIVTSRTGRVHTDAQALVTLARQHDILVDLMSGTILGRSGRSVEGRGVAASILVTLAESAEPVSAERLYQVVWGGNDYHPLRHRNTLYIALNRTRKLLEELGEAREVIRREGTGWIISPEIDLAIARRDPRVSTAGDLRRS
jgi:tetratricopeptide (TPR) repeat protein